MLIHNIGQLITLAPLAEKDRPVHIDRNDLGVIEKAWLLLEGNKVKEFGSGSPPHKIDSEAVDAKGGLILPGLVDCHTHPVFGGNRSSEFARRLDGATYQEIAAGGGGILSSVAHTRAASEEDLTAEGLKNLHRFLRNGVTTVEAKSGYGLDVENELKILRAIKNINLATPQTVKSTCLALHAVAKDTTKEAYTSAVIDTLLPKVAEQGLAEYVDAFVEKGYFEPHECEQYFAAAKKLGFKIRVHADEFQDSGAAIAAARWEAVSADHLEKASDEGIAAMATAGVTAVLLPGTSLYCKIDYADGKRFTRSGCEVALATDFNPGSCRVDNLSFIATIGALHCGLTVAEAVAAVTYVPAKSLDLHQTKGHLSKTSDADLVLYQYKTIDDWIADLGQKKPEKVWIGGQLF
jgi:imidazolonepropionase